MKWNILINQKAIVETGLEIDIIDAAILTYFADFILTGKMKKITDDTGEFYWVSYSEVIKQLPILGIASKDAIYRRFKKLVEKGLILPHKDNQVLQTSFYKMGSKFGKLLFSEPTDETPMPPGLFALPPTDGTPDNNPINDSTIKTKEEKRKEEKIGFCKLIIEFVKSNPNKYPKRMYFEFARHWLESSKGGKMRFQDERFFEVGKRLATWFNLAVERKTNIQQYWEAETTTPALNEQLKTLL